MGHHFDDFRFFDMLTFCIALAAFILALVYNPQKDQFQGAVVPIGVNENPLLYSAAIELQPITFDGDSQLIPMTIIQEYVNPSGTFTAANNAITFTPPSQNEYFYEIEVGFSFIPNAFTGYASFFIGFNNYGNPNNSFFVRMDTTVDTPVSYKLTALYHSIPEFGNSFLLYGMSPSQGTITFISAGITIKAIRGAPL